MNLNKLQYLDLSSNQIAALQPLSAMTKLSALYLAENQIEELAPLAGLANLSSLDLAKNKIADIRPLGVIERFRVLKLSDNAIEDIGPAAKHPPQSMLLVERNKIADLAPLVEAAQGRCRRAKELRPLLAALSRRQSAVRRGQERATGHAQASRRADRELSGGPTICHRPSRPTSHRMAEAATLSRMHVVIGM